MRGAGARPGNAAITWHGVWLNQPDCAVNSHSSLPTGRERDSSPVGGRPRLQCLRQHLYPQWCIYSSGRALGGRKGRDHLLRRHHHWQRRGRRHPGHHLAPSGKKILLLELGGWMTRKTENWNAEEVCVNSQVVLVISPEPKRPQPSSPTAASGTALPVCKSPIRSRAIPGDVER